MPTNKADVFNAHALELMRAGDYPSAYRYLREALRQTPDDMHSLNNLASTLKQLGRESEALPIYKRLTVEHPEFKAPFNNLAFSYLRLSRYAEGWKMYRHRLDANKKLMDQMNPLTGRPLHSEPMASLDGLGGKDLIVVPEQGLGDELFFLRFLPILLKLAPSARAFYAPSVKMFPVARKLDLPALLTDMSFSGVPKGNAVAVPLGDLPLLCGHDGSWFPPSLRLKSEAVYSTTPDHLDRCVGVTWRAGNRELVHRGGISKAVPPEELGWALRDDPRRIVVMQRNLHPTELAAFKTGLGHERVEAFEHDAMPAGKELMAIVVRLASLDAYVGVSNTNMHMLAALGRTARVLVIHPAEWRWPIAGESASPWFPGFKLYRQSVLGWENALTYLHDDLALDHAHVG